MECKLCSLTMLMIMNKMYNITNEPGVQCSNSDANGAWKSMVPIVNSSFPYQCECWAWCTYMPNGKTLDNSVDEGGIPCSESLNGFLCWMIVKWPSLAGNIVPKAGILFIWKKGTMLFKRALRDTQRYTYLTLLLHSWRWYWSCPTTSSWWHLCASHTLTRGGSNLRLFFQQPRNRNQNLHGECVMQ